VVSECVRLVDTTRPRIWFIWYVVDKEVIDSLYSRHNTRPSHVYVFQRSSLVSLKPGLWQLRETPWFCCTSHSKNTQARMWCREDFFLTRVLLNSGIHWLQRRLLQFIVTTGNNFTSFCFDRGRDSPEKLVLAT